jgi:hypothetical protein
MEELSKYVSAEMNSSNNKELFSVRYVLRSYKKDKEDRLSQLSFEKPACKGMSLGAEELN